VSLAVYLFINLRWKISVHTGFVTASLTVLILLYGAPGVIMAPLIPLVGWSRIELEYHSPAQVVAGALLVTVIVLGVFHIFGLTGQNV